ncbi:hypothetical protein BJY00DRAFT_315616 [Aspergillus carlsbadensis]|nr:hypothetical protein BJY00DRAFT_315616 [Aspergillus carlsbadensis]
MAFRIPRHRAYGIVHQPKPSTPYLAQMANMSNAPRRPQEQLENRVFSDKSDNIYEYLKKRQDLEDVPVRRSHVAIVERGRALNVPTFILNSARTRSDLAREYGWVPKYVDGHMQTTIAEEIKFALAQ